MSVSEFLKGFKPQVNEDGPAGDVAVKGHARTKVNVLRPDKNKEGKIDRYLLELETMECLEGKINLGKRFWKRYYQDSQESIQELCNDMFTAGIKLDTTGDVTAFEASFAEAIEKPVIVRAWGHKFTTKQDGTPIPPEDQKDKQFFIIKASAPAPKAGGVKKEVPF